MRLTRRMGVLSVAIVVAGKVSMAPAAGAQYSYVPSPPPCPAPPPPIPPAMKRSNDVVTVAVLALHLQRSSATVRYLADAFPDAIARRLSALPGVALFAPYAVRRLPPTTAPNAARVAREMGVRFVLTGLLTARGGEPRLDVVLYDSLASAPAWREEYKVDAASLADAEPSAATQVGERLQATLTGDERGALARRATRSDAAFVAYLKAEDAARERGVGYTQRAIALYRDAIAADPSFADAHAGLALALLTTLEDGTREALAAPDSVARAALRSAELSTAFDPKSARAWSARGLALAFIPSRWKDARGAFDHARTLAPNNPEVAWRRARALLRMGRRQEAEAGLRAALQLSPAFAPALADLGDLALGDRRTELACSWLNAAITADPYRPLSYALRAMARPGERDVRLGWSDAEIAVRLGARTYGEAAYALVDARGGDSTRARARILRLFRELDRRPRIGVTDARLAALALVVIGDYPRAVSLLERAYPRDGMLSVVLDDPALAVLRRDPRFMRIVNATGAASTGRAGDGRVMP